MALASELTRTGRTYLRTVTVLGFFVIGESLFHLYQVPPQSQWTLLAILTLISGSASVYLPFAHVSISISEAFVFTAVLLYGPAAGTLTVALDCLVISFWIARRRRDFGRALFNIAAPALSAWCSAHLFFYASGVSPLVERPAPLDAVLPSLVLFALAYFGLNSWLIAFAIAFEKRENPWSIWRNSFIWLSLNYFCGASVAILLVGYNRTIDLRFVGVVVPLLLVLYFTFKTSMQRIEDANRHVEQINTLYLSTIETLAMAIDAKDQVTHGHIRRVQGHATRLAVELGVRDGKLIKAIEAAALLHDMGKLAVPEYILNKPGRLTEAEFEKMKLHASVGADILSAIEFPYPVVPIVRHHHECWNGSGYPTGLVGTAIPIGARILAVVDCFDALTSDRPYRPRLSDEEAISILRERSGVMYDPLVVDSFIRIHSSLPNVQDRKGLASDVLDTIAVSRREISHDLEPARLDEITASADEMLTVYELARALAGRASVADAGDVIAKHLRRLIPFSLGVFYIYDSAIDELEAIHTVGDGGSLVLGTRIQLGQRLSGWVAANRKTIANSDAVLDLGDSARSHPSRLRVCLSTPLISDDRLVGVVTLYSGEHDFTDDHRRIIELVAPQIAHTFSRSTEAPSNTRDTVTGLPDFRQLEQFVEAGGNDRLAQSSVTLLFVDIVGLKQINMAFGRPAGDEVLRHVANRAKAALRVADILFRYSGDDFVAILNEADSETSRMVIERIRSSIRESPVVLRTGRPLPIDVEVYSASTVEDGRSLKELITAARLKSESTTYRTGPIFH